MRSTTLAVLLKTFSIDKSYAVINDESMQIDLMEMELLKLQKIPEKWQSQTAITLLNALEAQVKISLEKASVALKSARVDEVKKGLLNSLIKDYEQLLTDCKSSYLDIDFNRRTFKTRATVVVNSSRSVSKNHHRHHSEKLKQKEKSVMFEDEDTFSTLEKAFAYFSSTTNQLNVPIKWFAYTLQRYAKTGLNDCVATTLAQMMCDAVLSRDFDAKFIIIFNDTEVTDLHVEIIGDDAAPMKSFKDLLMQMNSNLFQAHCLDLKKKLITEKSYLLSDDLNEQKEAAIKEAEKLREIILSAKKIYKALMDGQSGPWKSNHLLNFNYANAVVLRPSAKTMSSAIPENISTALTSLDDALHDLNVEKAMLKHLQHHAMSQTCRTADALRLATIYYTDCSPKNTDLVNRIHRIAYKNSWFFKKTRAGNSLSQSQIENAPDGSRTHSIKAALGPSW